MDQWSIPIDILPIFEYVKPLLQNTKPISSVNFLNYDAILFCGGHGAIVDFPNNPYVANLILNMYRNRRIVAAVCHGVAGLVNVKDEYGSFLLLVSVLPGLQMKKKKQCILQTGFPFC